MPDPTSASLLTIFLTNQDQHCPQCQYNLRNLQGTRCPECGEELVLRVNMAEPRQRLLIAGLIGLSAGAGLNGLLLIYLFLRVSARSGGQFFFRFGMVNAVGLIVEALAITLWLVLWRKIRRRSVLVRWLLVGICWSLTLIDLLVFAYFIQ
jgi:predicted RNA-binding Zn-ribbon protein involved in translation (DUF1610 family)